MSVSTVMHTESDAQGEYCSMNCETSQLIQRAWKTEIRLTREQDTTCRQWCGATRFLYNWALSARKENYEARKAAKAACEPEPKSLTRFDQGKELTQLQVSPDYAWLKSVPRSAKEYAIEDLDLAFKHFFRRCKTGETPGFPRFKSWRDAKQSFRLRKSIVVEPRRVRLPVLGWVHLKERFYVPSLDMAAINSATVSLYAGKWFVSLQAEAENATDLENGGRHAELDFSLPYVMRVTCDGETEQFDAAKPLFTDIRRLRRLSRIVSRRRYDAETRKESNRRKGARLRFQKFHAEVARRREHYVHNLSAMLVERYGRFTVTAPPLKAAIEDCEEGDGLPIADAGWGEFLRQLKYKTEWTGGTYVVADVE